MKLVTLKQVKKVLELLEDFPAEQLQKLLEGGYFSDLLKANVSEMNRYKFRELCGLVSISTKFPVWKTIKLGTGLKTADDFRKAPEDKGFGISEWAKDILGKPAFKAAAKETEVDLVKVTVAELGFKNGARRGQIYERAKELGLDLCPAEVGPQLRLQYKDQPNGEWLFIGMEPITGSDGELSVFRVLRPVSELWLFGHYASPDSFWPPDRWWVFVRPRKSH